MVTASQSVPVGDGEVYVLADEIGDDWPIHLDFVIGGSDLDVCGRGVTECDLLFQDR